jgi:hypothetical protein
MSCYHSGSESIVIKGAQGNNHDITAQPNIRGIWETAISLGWSCFNERYSK